MTRRIIQIISVIFLNAGNLFGKAFRLAPCPILNCDGCAFALFACPIGMFQRFLAIQSFDFISAGFLLLVGLIVGKMMCAYVCPFGFFQELLAKIPVKKLELPKWAGYIKYITAALLVGAVPYFWGMKSKLSFCYLCPAGTLEAHIPSIFMGTASISFIKIGILAAVIVGAIFYKRFFCKVFCPITVVYGILNHYSFYQMKLDKELCTTCKACEPVCPAGIKFHENDTSEDCIRCGECKTACKFDAVKTHSFYQEPKQ